MSHDQVTNLLLLLTFFVMIVCKMRLERLDSGVLNSAVLTMLASEEKLSLYKTHTAASVKTCRLLIFLPYLCSLDPSGFLVTVSLDLIVL